ncbi:MAG: ATP-dependent sacrificial sulfur transferase LarE [Candidatus Thorarchaeota archaeon]|nr:ATP-dependent sacrificial sulfur transferase LarE [Candidatus Thorarchaeota archaeon]
MTTMTASLEEKLDIAKNVMKGKSVLVAFSGGVDSTALASLANEVADLVLLLTVNSPTIPSVEKNAAKEVALELGLKHEEVDVDWLGKEDLVENPKNRCYICKKQLAQIWKLIADQKNLEIVVEGSNASEMLGYRPGAAALKEVGILSPFLEANLTKPEIRTYLRKKGLSVADSPSMACLATRFPYGTPITQEKLNTIEKMECAAIEVFGVKSVRARYHQQIVRIEVGADEREKTFDVSKLDRIGEIGKSLGFDYVTIDVQGYRTGSMDETKTE